MCNIFLVLLYISLLVITRKSASVFQSDCYQSGSKLYVRRGLLCFLACLMSVVFTRKLASIFFSDWYQFGSKSCASRCVFSFLLYLHGCVFRRNSLSVFFVIDRLKVSCCFSSYLYRRKSLVFFCHSNSR